MKKLSISFCLLVFNLACLVSSAAFAKPLQLALNWKPEPQFGGFYAAEMEGLYKKKGLDVEIIPGGAGTPTVQVVAAGKAEFGIVSGEEVLISRSRGTDIVAIFSVYETFPRVVMAHSERKFKSIQEIFQSPGSIAVQGGIPFFVYLENRYGKPKSQVVPYLGGVGNFMNDPNYSQQAFANAEPLLAKQKGQNVSTFLLADEGYNPYSEVVVARKSFFDKNSDTVKNLVEAIREGWQIYLKNPEKTNSRMYQLNPSMDLQTFKRSAEAQKSFVDSQKAENAPLGSMKSSRWLVLGEQLKSMGLIKQIPNSDEIYKNF